MSNPDAKAEKEKDGPPIFKTWTQMYGFVLMFHLMIIIIFSLFTKYYS